MSISILLLWFCHGFQLMYVTYISVALEFKETATIILF